MNLKTPASAKSKAFTLVELIATIAIVAMLAVVLVVFIGGYIADAKRTADQQTLAVLNDALTRYKTQGGSLAALTSGASIGNVLTKLQTAVTWAGIRHQFLKSGTTYTAASISAIGAGAQFKFTRYGGYADGTEYSNGILSTYAADGYDVGDEEEFKNWLAEAMAETGTTNYLALTNPDTTDRIGINAKVANSGDKVRVWWGDGTTQDYNSISTSSSTVIAKAFSSAAKRTVVIVGDLGYIQSNNSLDLGGDGATYFGGDIGTMPNLTYISVWGSNTLSGDIGKLTSLATIGIGGSNTLSGDVSNLREVTYLTVQGNNTITGSISKISGLNSINVWGNNMLSGSITGLTGLTTLSIGGSNTIDGSITGQTSLTYLNIEGNNSISGLVTGFPLEYLRLLGNSTIDTASTISISNTATGLGYLNLNNNHILDQAQVDTILTNMNNNKSETKPRSERNIYLNQANHATPSSVGLSAKAELQAAGWTVLTN